MNAQQQLEELFAYLAMRQERQEHLDTYNRLRQTPAQALTPDTAPTAEMWLRADSIEPFCLFDVKPLSPDMTAEEIQANEVRCPGTNFVYCHQRLPESFPIKTDLRHDQAGWAFFDGPVEFAVLYEQMDEDDKRKKRTWMSMTPSEMLTQFPGVRLAHGSCLVGGLGLGWFLKEIANKPEVTEITVVEKSAELLNWLKPVLQERFPAIAAKVKLWVNADIYDYVGGLLRNDLVKNYNVYLLDIWPQLGDADYDVLFAGLECFVGADKVWGWGRGTTMKGGTTTVDPSQRLADGVYCQQKPCNDCPFGITSAAGTEGMVDPVQLIGQAYGPFLLPCHQDKRYQHERFGDVLSLRQCAGAAIFRTHVGVAASLPAIFHTLPADEELVFKTPEELLAGISGMPRSAAEEFLRKVPPEVLMRREFSKNETRVLGAKEKS
jgi:hypothetical protein